MLQWFYTDETSYLAEPSSSRSHCVIGARLTSQITSRPCEMHSGLRGRSGHSRSARSSSCPIIFTASGRCRMEMRTSPGDGAGSRPISRITSPSRTLRSNEGQAASMSYGNRASGSTPFVTTSISAAMSITSTTIRSSTDLSPVSKTGPIRRSTLTFEKASCPRTRRAMLRKAALRSVNRARCPARICSPHGAKRNAGRSGCVCDSRIALRSIRATKIFSPSNEIKSRRNIKRATNVSGLAKLGVSNYQSRKREQSGPHPLPFTKIKLDYDARQIRGPMPPDVPPSRS